jgi:PAS domain S-box-containing protein
VGVLQSILTAMVRVNRASAGAIYLVDSPNQSLVQAATYGGEEDEDPPPGEDPNRIVPIDFGFVGRVAAERRPVVIPNIADIDDAPDVLATNPHVRSAVGVPIFDGQDALAGVAWVGLYVPYRFTQTSQARLQALAYRTVAFMESARLADHQVEELGRVQDSHRRLQAVIQTMPEAVMVIRPPHGQIVTSNAAAQNLFGLNKPGAQLNVRRIDQLNITPDPPELDIELPMMQVMLDGSTVTSVELLVHTADGRAVPVVASAAPLITDANEIDAVVGVFQDVSPLKEAERLRDEFISVVSHELRSPLTPIRGFAQVISRDLEREGGHEQHIKWLKTLELHTDRLTRLVDDLLDVSRMRAGRLSVLHEDVDLVEITAAVVESKRASQSTHILVLQTDLEELPVRMDRDRLMQVLDNLIGNAIKYTDGGTVTVNLSADDAHIHITITDEGRGIPERDREPLFNAFYRTRDANESAVPGLGLGLYIVRELILAHDGTVHIDEAPGGGARFNIELPRNPTSDAPE